MNTYFEEKVGEILEMSVPMKCIQIRIFFRNWIDEDLKNLMSERDHQREKARNSGDPTDWSIYKNLRNNCTNKLKKKKNVYMSNLYDTFKEKK